MTMVTATTTPALSSDGDVPEVVIEPDGFVVVRIPVSRPGPLAPLDDARARELLDLARRVGALWTEDPETPHPAFVARADALRRSLDDLLTPRLGELDPIPHATIIQAIRRARLRTDLLASGAFTLAALAEGRRQSMAAVRQWAHRARQRNAIFTVKHDGETLVPAFLLDLDLDPRPEYTGAIEALTPVGRDGWGLWAWFALPTSWLSGDVPAEVALCNPDRVTRAARDDASNSL